MATDRAAPSPLERPRAMNLSRLLDRFRRRPTRDAFATALMRGLRTAGDTSELRYEPDVGRILRMLDGKASGVINLGNMFAIYSARPHAERADYLRNCVRSALTQFRELPDDFDSARPDLRPRIWSRLGLERARQEKRLDGGFDVAGLPSEPVGEHLVATLGYDWPESVQSINQANLDAWGVTFYEAMEVARDNLREATPGYAKVGDGFFAFVAGDSYDASRLVLSDLIATLEVDGDPVVLAPNRDGLLITGSDDEAGLAMLAGIGAQRLHEPYPMSGSPLILHHGEWLDWLPPAGHPLRRQFIDLRTDWLGPEYTQQKQLLDAIHEREGVDLFVASLSGLQRDGGERITYCVWGQGITALLPEAEKVVFIADDQAVVALADWDHVRAVVDHRMHPTEHYPARWRVDSFPDPAEVLALGKAEM